jgi:hypothetical protein
MINKIITILIIVAGVLLLALYLLKNGKNNPHNQGTIEAGPTETSGLPSSYVVNVHPNQLRIASNTNISEFTPAEIHGFQPGITGNEEWYPTLTNKDVNGYMWSNAEKIRQHIHKTGMPVVAYHRHKESFDHHFHRTPIPVYSLNNVDDSKGVTRPVLIIGWTTLQLESDASVQKLGREPQAAWILYDKDMYGKNILYLRGANFNGIEEEVYGTVKINID